MAGVVLENVTRRYPGSRAAAVSDLCLRIGDGELVVLLGPSGCGKTTTLRLVAGLEKADAGVIRVGDRTIAGAPPADRSVAMVFQDHAVYPHMTVAGNLAFRLRRARTGSAARDAAVREMAGLLGLEDRLERLPEALSGGECQRLALGRALIGNPAVCLLDEPLGNLDAPLRGELRAWLRALQRRLGTTTLLVTHDQEEALSLGDRIGVLAAGRLQQLSSPRETYHRPANRFVAGFVGWPPMNFIDGEVAGSEAHGQSFRAGGLRVDLPGTSRRAAAAVLGVRPHDLRIERSAAAPGALPARVESVAAGGPWTDVCAVTGGGIRLLARVGGDAPVQEGVSIGIVLDPSRVHLFEPGPFGRSLSTGPLPPPAARIPAAGDIG